MARRFLVVTILLAATVGVLVGMVLTGSMSPAPAMSATPRLVPARTANAAAAAPALTSFADIAERLNPAVVNIDAVQRGNRGARRRFGMQLPDSPDMFDRQSDQNREGPRRGSGTGFVIDPSGLILTNHHVIVDADRIMVRLTDGRNLRGERIGSDPDTDIALIKVETTRPLPFAPMGNSDTLRVGEWVLAIGNPLAYEHTVTVGVVSFIGRKLFDPSLDNYIQTDAAISFGNSGGPLINSRGQVIGINSAVSKQASNIGFAVPINQARSVLKQLKTIGRVDRGYIGVTLRDVDPDIQSSLKLARADGALVQDVTPGSPGARVGIKPYDVITAIDGEAVRTHDRLIREIAERQPGSSAKLEYMRDGRMHNVQIKLAERPRQVVDRVTSTAERSIQRTGPGELGLSLIEIDDSNAHRFDIPAGMTGLLVQRVEPLSVADDGGIERGAIILEINRQPVNSVAGFRRIVGAARPGDVLAFYLYEPELDQRAIRTVRTESR